MKKFLIVWLTTSSVVAGLAAALALLEGYDPLQHALWGFLGGPVILTGLGLLLTLWVLAVQLEYGAVFTVLRGVGLIPTSDDRR